MVPDSALDYRESIAVDYRDSKKVRQDKVINEYMNFGSVHFGNMDEINENMIKSLQTLV